MSWELRPHLSLIQVARGDKGEYKGWIIILSTDWMVEKKFINIGFMQKFFQERKTQNHP